MALVGYSDSDTSSDDGKSPSTKLSTKPSVAKTSSRPAFKKVIDSSNPRKIVVNLKSETQKDDLGTEEPPAKKARIGGGGLSGFNAMLPAPKRSGAIAGTNTKQGGLGRGISLKTGAAPGFSRESIAPAMEPTGDDKEANGRSTVEENVNDRDVQTAPPSAQSIQPEEPKKVGNPMMFKPLSVARKPQKKKTNASSNLVGTKTTPFTNTTLPSDQSKHPPKISLFSIENDSESVPIAPQATAQTAPYRPLLHNPAPAPSEDPVLPTNPTPPPGTLSSGDQSLTNIANDLHLSASARRQLLGRNASANVKITHFNTDAEYANNELLRQSGEEQVHNPVRAIAAGKHSLKQLVSAVSNQKDALEDSFAAGRRNRKEAGSKYGW